MKLKYLAIGLFLLILVTYGILAVLVLNLRGRASPEQPGFTAREAYPSALREAQTWQDDCQLVSANASWRAVGPEQILEDEEVSWGFTFFSPGTRSLASFAVTAAGAERVQTRDASPNTRAIEAARWQIDSPQVLTAFLNQGGRELLERDPATSVSLRLGPGQSDHSMVWVAIGIPSNKQDAITVQVDPSSGEVVAASV